MHANKTRLFGGEEINVYGVCCPTQRNAQHMSQSVFHKLGRKEKPEMVSVIGKVCMRTGGWEKGKS